jgi:WD40 repeat protein
MMTEPGERLWSLWERGQRPELASFLEGAGPLSPPQLLAVLRVDQCCRWRAGDGPPAEAYLERFPELAASPEDAVELVYGEWLLRQERGAAPAVADFLGRFPTLASRLEQQLAFREAMGGDTTLAPPSLPPTVSAARPGPSALPAPPGYEVLEELGRGGMAVVYRARQRALGREVALKVLRAEAGPSELERLRLEAAAVARLQHPNVVQIHEVGEWDGRPYLALELVAGGSLARALGGRPLAPVAAAGLVRTLAEAVQHAHDAGVIHRDLKPANVLLAGPATPQAAEGAACGVAGPKITDFGLARSLTGATGHTQTGAILGTPSYMAPEQAEGKKDVGPAADVYGLGAVLYECLTGRPPFLAATVAEALRLVTESEPVPPSRLQPGLPRDLQIICLKCLEKAPRRRYASAGELADDLGRFLAGRPIQARATGPLERAAKWARRRPAAALLILVSALALAALAGLGLAHNVRLGRALDEVARERDEARRQRDEARRNLYLSCLPLAQRAWDENRGPHALRLLEQLVPRPGERDLRDFEWHYLWRQAHFARWVARRDGPVTCLAWAPDGRLLASGGKDGTVRLHDGDTGAERAALRGQGPVVGLAFAADGKQLSCVGTEGELAVWEVGSGQRLRRVAVAAGPLHCVAFHPAGALLAVARPDGTVELREPGSSKAAGVLKGHAGKVTALAFSRTGDRLAVAGRHRKTLAWGTEVWDVPGRRVLFTLAGPGLPVTSVAFSPDAQHLTTGADRRVVYWRLTAPKKAQWSVFQKDSRNGVTHVTFSPDGRWLASASEKAWLKDLKQPQTATFQGHALPIEALAFRPDSGALATGGKDGTVRLWPLDDKQEVTHIPTRPIGALAFSPDGKEIAAALPPDSQTVGGLRLLLRRETLWVVDPGTGKALWSKEHPAAVTALAARPEGDVVATACLDGKVRLFEGHSGRPLEERVGPTNDDVALFFRGSQLIIGKSAEGPAPPPVVRTWDRHGREARALHGAVALLHCLAYGPGGKRLAGAGAGRTILVWGAAGGRPVVRLAGHTGAVEGLAFLPDGTLVSASADGTVRTWDVAEGRLLKVLIRQPPALTGLAVSADGSLLATSGGDGAVRLWGAGGEERAVFRDENGKGLRGVALSPDGSRMAAATADRAVIVWDVASGSKLATLEGHTQQVRALAFAPNGARLATASAYAVRVWETTSGLPLLRLRGGCDCLAFSPAGDGIAGGAWDGLRIWDGRPLPENAGGAGRIKE